MEKYTGKVRKFCQSGKVGTMRVQTRHHGAGLQDVLAIVTKGSGKGIDSSAY